MDNFLGPIQTRPLSSTLPITLSIDGGPQPSIEQLANEPLLTVLSTTKYTGTPSPSVPVPGPDTTNFSSPQRSHPIVGPTLVTTAEDALSLLRCSPSSTQLGNILDYLIAPAEDGHMEIHSPTPTSSQIVKILVDITIPNFWPAISNVEKRKLVKCLRSVLGMRGIVARMSLLAAESTDGMATVFEGNKRDRYRELVEVLAQVMGKTTLLWEVWRTVFLSSKEGRLRGEILWKEFVGMISGGKVLGVGAAAVATTGVRGEEANVGMQEGRVTRAGNEGEEKRDDAEWIGDPNVYATWLGNGVVTMAEKLHEISQEKKEADETLPRLGWKCLRMLFWRAFGLGITSWGMLYLSSFSPLSLPFLLLVRTNRSIRLTVHSKMELLKLLPCPFFFPLLGFLAGISFPRLFVPLLYMINLAILLLSSALWHVIILTETYSRSHHILGNLVPKMSRVSLV